MGEIQKYSEPLVAALMDDRPSFGGVTLYENANKVIEIFKGAEKNRKVWNHRNSQWMWQNLTMFQSTPMRTMRQISSELENKRAALLESKVSHGKQLAEMAVKQEEVEANGQTPAKLAFLEAEIAEIQTSIVRRETQIEGAFKDVIILGDLHKQLEKRFEGWDEEDFEKEEARSHLIRSLKQCLRDVRQFSRIGKGEQEFLEQCGLHPTKVLMHLTQYITDVEQHLEGFSVGPLEEFLDKFAETLLPYCNEAALRRGWSDEINTEAIYKEQADD